MLLFKTIDTICHLMNEFIYATIYYLFVLYKFVRKNYKVIAIILLVATIYFTVLFVYCCRMNQVCNF